MTTTIKRIGLGIIAAAALSLGVTAGVHAGAQDQNTNEPRRPFMGGPGRHGGPDGAGRFGGPMGLLPMLPPALNLTDAQRQQIRTIADSHRDEWKAFADRARPVHDALRQAITGGTVDDALIRAKSADLAAIEADMNVARAHVGAEVAQVLTADQKAKLKEILSRRSDRAKQGPSAPREQR